MLHLLVVGLLHLVGSSGPVPTTPYLTPTGFPGGGVLSYEVIEQHKAYVKAMSNDQIQTVVKWVCLHTGKGASAKI